MEIFQSDFEFADCNLLRSKMLKTLGHHKNKTTAVHYR